MSQQNGPFLDPQWSYKSALQQIQDRKDLARQLESYQMQQGRVTNPGGFYAGGTSGLDAFGKAASMILAAYQQQQAGDQYKTAEANQMQLMKEAQQGMTTPSEGETKALDPSNWGRYLYNNPENVGPQPEQVAQSFPVAPQSNIQTTDLPKQPIGVSQPQPAPFVSGGGGQFRGNGATGSWGDEPQVPPRWAAAGIEPKVLQNAPQRQPVLPQATQAQPVPQPVQQPVPQPATALPTATAVQPQPDPQGLSIAADASRAALLDAKRQAGVLRLAREADAVDKMRRAGRNDLADRYAFPEPKSNEFGVEVKDGKLVRFNKRTGEFDVADIGTGGSDAAQRLAFDKEKDAREQAAKASEGQAKVTAGEQALKEFDAANEKYAPEFIDKGTLKGYWNGAMSLVPGTDEKQARLQIEREVKSGALTVIQSLNSSKVVDSNAERQALEATWANIDWFNPESVKTGLANIRARTKAAVDRSNAANENLFGAKPAQPGTINGLPAPGPYQGKTIRP